MISRLFLFILFGFGFLLLQAQDRFEAPETDTKQTTKTKSETVAYAKTEALEILKDGIAVDGKYRRFFRKSDRWKKRAIKRLDKANKELEAYQDQAKRWVAAMAKDLSKSDVSITDEVSTADIRAYDTDLFSYIKDMEAHHQWLITQWMQSTNPPIGDRIAYTENQIHALLAVKEELMQKAEDSPSFTLQVKGLNDHISSLLSYLKSVYKHTVPIATDGAAMYEILEMAHAIYPEYKNSKAQKGQGEANTITRQQFTRFIGETIKAMDDAYFRAIALARQANAESIEVLETTPAEENIEKLRAQLEEQQRFMQIFRAKYYSQRPPRVEYAQR